MTFNDEMEPWLREYYSKIHTFQFECGECDAKFDADVTVKVVFLGCPFCGSSAERRSPQCGRPDHFVKSPIRKSIRQHFEVAQGAAGGS